MADIWLSYIKTNKDNVHIIFKYKHNVYKSCLCTGPKPCFTTFYSTEITQSVFYDYNKPKIEKKDDWIYSANKRCIYKLYIDQ